MGVRNILREGDETLNIEQIQGKRCSTKSRVLLIPVFCKTYECQAYNPNGTLPRLHLKELLHYRPL
jgi:hypothetical protein